MLTGQVITANRLDDGVVVFFTPQRAWGEVLGDSHLFADAATAATALANAKLDEARDIVVDPYLIDVVDRNGAIAAKHLREVIRATGPTIRRDLGKQADMPAKLLHAQ